MIRKGVLYISFNELDSICCFLFGFKFGLDISNKIKKEFINNERQSFSSK